jgi:hypothetical protein
MANDKPGTGKGAPQSGTGKRPYATLDLKATEIKAGPATSRSTGGETPRPAPASSYATAASDKPSPGSAAPRASDTSAKSRNGTRADSTAEADSSKDNADSFGGSRGGVIRHLAAGVVGGALAFAILYWLVPMSGLSGNTSELGADVAALTQRLSGLEQNQRDKATASDVQSLEGRVGDLEKTAQTIPALTDRQRQLVAETKAALASAASDKGSTQLIDRVAKVESTLKALEDAGANDPNANRVEQLAALTGKVSDLQTSLATQLSALRASLTKDVESRVQTAAQTSETARAGMQRLDGDVATLKNETAALEQTSADAKAARDQLAANLKATQDATTQLNTALEGLKTSAAKPADITAALAPVSDRIAALETSVQGLVQGDAKRKESAQHVVLAIELQNLKRALDSGQQYTTELAQIKNLAGDNVDLSALSKLQDSGVPSLADLKAEFRTAAAKAMDADSHEEDTTVLGRLWSEAKSVVRVRRIDLKPGDKSTEATLGRMQVALNDGRLDEVLDAAKDLSPNATDAAQPFLDKVAARVSVDQALASIEAQLKSSIASGSEPDRAKPDQQKP